MPRKPSQNDSSLYINGNSPDVLMAKMADAIGEKRDAVSYRKQAKTVKKAFNKSFFDTKKNIYVDGIGTKHASLHANMYALVFGLVPESIKPSVVEFIKQKRMVCGVYGATYLFDAIGQKLDIIRDLQKCFPETYKQILSTAYYLILEDKNQTANTPSTIRKAELMLFLFPSTA